jgi:hypothetical protein
MIRLLVGLALLALWAVVGCTVLLGYLDGWP